MVIVMILILVVVVMMVDVVLVMIVELVFLIVVGVALVVVRQGQRLRVMIGHSLKLSDRGRRAPTHV